MSEILVASLPPAGHIGPLLNVAQGLVDRGDRVTVLTSEAHAPKIRAMGAIPRAIPAEADFDLTRLDIDLPGRADTSGIKRVNFDIVRPVPAADAAPGACAVGGAGADAVRRDHHRRRLLRNSAVPARRPHRPAAGAGLHHHAVDGEQPRHGAERHGSAAVVDPARSAAQPHADGADAEGVAAASRRTPRTTCWIR